jgi:hypothetical protein
MKLEQHLLLQDMLRRSDNPKLSEKALLMSESAKKWSLLVTRSTVVLKIAYCRITS